jgi:hypothetical protein
MVEDEDWQSEIPADARIRSGGASPIRSELMGGDCYSGHDYDIMILL